MNSYEFYELWKVTSCRWNMVKPLNRAPSSSKVWWGPPLPSHLARAGDSFFRLTRSCDFFIRNMIFSLFRLGRGKCSTLRWCRSLVVIHAKRPRMMTLTDCWHPLIRELRQVKVKNCQKQTGTHWHTYIDQMTYRITEPLFLAPINSPRIDPCQEVELLCLMTEESVTSKAVFFAICTSQSNTIQHNPTPTKGQTKNSLPESTLFSRSSPWWWKNEYGDQ